MIPDRMLARQHLGKALGEPRAARIDADQLGVVRDRGAHASRPARRSSPRRQAAVADLVRLGTLVKVRLQDDLRRDLVAHAASAVSPTPASASATVAASVVKRSSTSSTVKLEARLELPREAPRARRHGVRRSVGVRRQPDHQQRRLPFLDQRRDRREAVVLAVRGDRRQRMREPERWSRRPRRRCAVCRNRMREWCRRAERAAARSPPSVTRARPRRTAAKNRFRAVSSPPTGAFRPAARTSRRGRPRP